MILLQHFAKAIYLKLKNLYFYGIIKLIDNYWRISTVLEIIFDDV